LSSILAGDLAVAVLPPQLLEWWLLCHCHYDMGDHEDCNFVEMLKLRQLLWEPLRHEHLDQVSVSSAHDAVVLMCMMFVVFAMDFKPLNFFL
jgi:hypothetical protein